MEKAIEALEALLEASYKTRSSADFILGVKNSISDLRAASKVKSVAKRGKCKRIAGEQIRHASVRAKNGMLLLGKSHAECFRQGAKIGLKMSSRACDQGFVTNKGRFVERPEAAKIARSAAQVPKLVKILFSENLWSKHDDGKFEYDQINGYHKTVAQQATIKER